MQDEKSKTTVRSPLKRSTTITIESLHDPENIADIVEDDDPDSFILNRFFNNNSKNIKETSQAIPVPKPRRSIKVAKAQSSSSRGTFRVTSPVALKRVNAKNDEISSVRTYKVVSPSHGVANGQEDVGDMIIHQAPTTSQRKLSESSSIASLKKQTKSSVLSQDTASNELSCCGPTFLDAQHDDLQALKDEVRPKPKKRRPKHYDSERDEDKKEKDIDEAGELSVIIKGDRTKKDQENVYRYEKITEVIVHRTDKLLLDSLVIHPLVKLHVVDINSGRYFAKSDKNRPVVFYYEYAEHDHMSPVMTKPFSLQENRSLYPVWEETILLNEDFNYIMKECSNIILFFEILDFLSSSAIKTHSIKNGWHRIAFAFLKLSGPNNEHNLQKKLRLQLYYLDADSIRPERHKCSIWRTWMKHKLRKYPSTLYVSIRSVTSPKKVVETFRSKTPIHGERSTRQLANEENNRHELKTSSFGEQTEIRQHLASCENNNKNTSKGISHGASRLPNQILGKLPSFDEGCFVMKFSNNGFNLACGVLQDTIYTVVVYSVELLEEVQKFPGHKGLIYDIEWSKDDSLLMVASADCTVSVWNLKSNKFLQILPHPSYVYTCKVDQEYMVATGCYDKTIRIWMPQENVKFNLTQELEQHTGYITCLNFNRKSNLLYSSDAVGMLLEWSREDDNWKLNRDISVLDLKHTVINQIILFCKERKLLIHARDSTLRIFDLKNACVLQWLQGSLNRRVQTFCSISSCETFVICGSENGILNVWSARTGEQVASYLSYCKQCPPVHSVQFHPSDNTMAISHYGNNLPILLCTYNENVTDEEIGLKILNEEFFNNCMNVRKQTRNKKFTFRRGSIKEDKSFDFRSILEKMDELIEPHLSETK